MIEIEVRDGLYHVRGPKFELCLTKAEFIAALQRAKRVTRQQQRSARVAPIDGHNRGVCCVRP
jgi:hypothetical protein